MEVRPFYLVLRLNAAGPACDLCPERPVSKLGKREIGFHQFQLLKRQEEDFFLVITNYNFRKCVRSQQTSNPCRGSQRSLKSLEIKEKLALRFPLQEISQRRYGSTPKIEDDGGLQIKIFLLDSHLAQSRFYLLFVVKTTCILSSLLVISFYHSKFESWKQSFAKHSKAAYNRHFPSPAWRELRTPDCPFMAKTYYLLTGFPYKPLCCLVCIYFQFCSTNAKLPVSQVSSNTRRDII